MVEKKRPIAWRVRAQVNDENVDTYILGHNAKDAADDFFAECDRLGRIVVSIYITLANARTGEVS